MTLQRIVDGDTLVVAGEGGMLPDSEAVRVRLLEVDTPEVGDCYAAKATARTRALLPAGSTVRVERDADLKDPYGRYLLYAWNAQGEFVNLSLVSDGYAKAVLFEPNDRYWPRISGGGEEAEKARNGMWKGCDSRNTAPAEPEKPRKPSKPDTPGRPEAPEPREKKKP